MLELKNLKKTYHPKKGVPVVALNDVSLNIKDKGLVFILGKSGSGKSTLMNLLGGLDKYDSGDIVIKGKSTKDFSQADFDSYRNTYVGFIFQEYNILDDFSVGANIALAIELQGRKATNEEVNKILKTLDLDGYGARRTNELSGGQKQRIAIARALVKNPDIILADEPTGALDSKTGEQIFNILKKLSEEKLVIVVSHDRDFAERFGDRVIELADGKIISDISKARVKSDSTNINIQYVEKEGLIVKEGYELTAKDLEMVNRYLRDQKSLSLVSKPSDDFHIREVFAPTKNEEVPKVYGNEFKLIKSRLPSRMAFIMGASGLKHKKFRLVMTIFLSLIAFCLFGIADSLAAYNRVDATVNSIIDGHVDAVAFSKRQVVEDEYGYLRKYDLTLSKEDIANINDTIGKEINLDFKPVFAPNSHYGSGSFGMTYNYATNNNVGQNSYYMDSISGLVEFTAADFDKLDFTIQGRLPTSNDEIAITKYLFEHFDVKGYSNFDGEVTDIPAESLNSPNDIFEKYISLTNPNLPERLKLKVVGVIDTNLDAERYEKLKSPITDIADYLLYEEFTANVGYGFHGIGFVNPGYTDTLIANSEQLGVLIGSNSYLFYYSESTNTYPSGIYLSPNMITKLSNYDMSDIFFFGEDKQTLAKDEIIANWSSIIARNQKDYQITGVTGDFNGTISEFMDAELNNQIEAYATANYQQAETRGLYEEVFDGQSNLDESQKIELYKDYLTGMGFVENLYGDKSGYDIKKEIAEGLRPFILENLEPITLTRDYSNYSIYNYIQGDARIVGIAFDKLYYTYSEIIVDDEFYEEISTYEKTEPYKFALAPMPSNNRSAIKKIAQFSLQVSGTGFSFPLQNYATPMLETANDLVENVASVFVYIGLGFALFSALMLSNFIASSVSFKKREIGILRAVGARSSDVFRIFFNESAIVAFINFVLSSIAAFVAVYFINDSLRSGVGLVITIFNFSFRQVGLLLLISFFVAFVASFLPVFNIARKKPVDAISNK